MPYARAQGYYNVELLFLMATYIKTRIVLYWKGASVNFFPRILNIYIQDPKHTVMFRILFLAEWPFL